MVRIVAGERRGWRTEAARTTLNSLGRPPPTSELHYLLPQVYTSESCEFAVLATK